MFRKSEASYSSKIGIFHTSIAFNASDGGGVLSNIVIPFGMEKSEWWGYATVKRLSCERRTDLFPRHTLRYAYASRGKNDDSRNMLCSIALRSSFKPESG